MDKPNPPGGRRLDGPVRRVHASPTTEPASAPVPTSPAGWSTKEIDPEPAGQAVAQVGMPPIQPPDDSEVTLPRRPRRLRRWVIGGIAVVVLGTVGWFGYHTWAALHDIIQKHTGTSALDNNDLAGLKEGSGRVNILLMGVGGAGHDGPDLSDTMMVWSIDPKTDDVAAISVPRDLYVKIPGNGANKINAANADGGPQLAEKVVSTVLGIDINYYVLVDFSGFKQAVDAVGGVTVNVPTALYDTAYPCDVGNGICPYHQPAGTIAMNGTTALKYVRCRHDAPTGNCGNDYGRSGRQQQIVAALKTKALSLGTLTNPAKLTKLIDTLGSHVKTDLQLSDLEKLAKLSSKVDSSKIVNKVLDDAPDNYLVGGVDIIPSAGYIYVPKAGTYDYDDIHDFVKNIFVDRYIVQENARLEVDNGSGVPGLAGKVTTSLKEAHYNVLPAANAPNLSTETVIYDYTNGKKPYTIKYLEQRFGVTAQKATPTAVPSSSAAASPTPTPVAPEIRIILGSNYAASSTN